MKRKGSPRRKGQLPLEYGVFAVYRGDQNIDDGTYDYIREKYHLSHNAIKFYCSTACHERNFAKERVKKHKKEPFELVRIDTIEEDQIFGED